MTMVCTRVTEWIRQEVSKPVEDWEEGLQKTCKKRKWYDPRGWLCWLVRVLVLVVRWVIVTVVTAVVTVVCHLVADLLSILWNVLKLLGNLFLALVTWDKCRLQAALGNVADALIGLGEIIGDVLIRPITDRVQTFRLRRHVGKEIDRRFADQPELADAIKQTLNVNTGVFGYRLTVALHRLYVDSQTRTPQSGDVPNLVFLHETGQINLFQLAGFDRDCAIFDKDGWRGSHPRTARKTFAGGGGDLIETDPPEISRDDLQAYLDSRGEKGPPFLILAMSIRALNHRIGAAETKGRQLGLLLSFDKKLKEVTDPQFMSLKRSAIVPVDPAQIDCATKPKAQRDLLICELGRRPEAGFVCCDAAGQRIVLPADPDAARGDLCTPVAAGVFAYAGQTNLSGLATNLIGTSGTGHDLADDITSGVTFRAQIPERVRQYVLIHELGHYFGLTHVDGFDRLMVSGEEGQGELFTGDSIPNIFWHGGPRFILTEAERVWDFILTHFPTACLSPPPPVTPEIP
jgi:hypothetical protein